jgi:hypothetical protein
MPADGGIPPQRKLRRGLRVRARDPFAEPFAGALPVFRYVSGGAGNQSVHCPHCGLMLTIGQNAHGPTLSYDRDEWKRRCKRLDLASPALCLAEREMKKP